jgi:glycerate kinase
VPTVAVAGRNELSAQESACAGLDAIYTRTQLEPDAARCMSNATQLLEQLGERMAANHLAAAAPSSQ